MTSGDLITVAGPIGAGKTTLLHAIMDETKKKAGTTTVRGSIAYVEQEPFIFSGTVSENITFGLEIDDIRLTASIKAAQLENDMLQLANGQDTVIGERGINVSGGQKARISLARAIYSNADIYLLDDPLSAVDPKVASGIFHECIRGALREKCVILVTHQLQFLRHSPRVMILKDGKQVLLGSYEHIC